MGFVAVRRIERRERAAHDHDRFRYTAEALINNMELVSADPKKVQALIVSHGHFDHYGGLIGFLDKYRSVLPADLTLYAGGEDNFCRRFAGAPGSLVENGVLDRREIATRNVKTVLAENPVVVGHAFTTGRSSVPARSACCRTAWLNSP